MRNAILVALALVAACHVPSLRDRATQLGGRFAAIMPHVDVRVVAPVIAAAVPVPQPVELHRSVVRTAASEPAAEPAPAPMPAMTVTRVDAASRTFFGMRYTKGGGGEACQRFDTIDACNSACTSLSQQRGMRGEANANCSCLEDAPGC